LALVAAGLVLLVEPAGLVVEEAAPVVAAGIPRPCLAVALDSEPLLPVPLALGRAVMSAGLVAPLAPFCCDVFIPDFIAGLADCEPLFLLCASPELAALRLLGLAVVQVGPGAFCAVANDIPAISAAAAVSVVSVFMNPPWQKLNCLRCRWGTS
jgi:hypothetical protein